MKSFRDELKSQFERFEKNVDGKLRNIYLDFPKYSTDFLTTLKTDPIKETKIFSSLMANVKWPQQQFHSGHFADLSFTLFRSKQFFLDLYVWHRNDTSIHDHHFAGAFKVVLGQTYNITYKFNKKSQLYPWLEQGELNLIEKIQLNEGDVKTIGFSSRFIHQNLHLTNPCMTLCLRTIDHPKTILSNYYNQGLKIRLIRQNLKDQKKIEALAHVFILGDHDSSNSLIKSIGTHTLYSVYIGQFPFYSRFGEGFFKMIEEELRRRDPDTIELVMKIIKNQTLLNKEVSQIIKS